MQTSSRFFFILSWLKMQINTKNLLYCFLHRFTLTLSYSSEGSLALSVFRHHELKTVISYIYLDFLTTSFLFLVVTLALKQNPRPHSAFTDFRALLPSANYSAEWFGWVWQPAADSNGRLANFFKICSMPNSHYFHHQRAATPDSASSFFQLSSHATVPGGGGGVCF